MGKVGRWSGGIGVSKDSAVSAVSVMEDELFKKRLARCSDWSAISGMSGMCCMQHPKCKGAVIERCSTCKTACQLFNDKLSASPRGKKHGDERLRRTSLPMSNASDKPATLLKLSAICRRNCGVCWRSLCLGQPGS